MTQATDINADSSCSWTVDPDLTLGSGLGLNDILALVAFPMGIALEATWPKATSKASGCSPNSGPPCDLFCHHLCCCFDLFACFLTFLLLLGGLGSEKNWGK